MCCWERVAKALEELSKCRIPHDEEQGFFLEQCPLQEVDKHEWYEGTGEHE